MKTSTILLLTAILIFLSTLGVYDFRIKTEYTKMNKFGSESYYRSNRFNDYNEVKVKSFDQVEILAANVVGITIEYGKKSGVFIRKPSMAMVDIKQSNNKLIVDLSKQGKADNYAQNNPVTIVIISSNLTSITTRAITFKTTSSAKEKANGADIIRHYGDCRTAIFGFKQNSLDLKIGASTNIRLHNNFLKFFAANVGDNDGDAELIVLSDNNLETVKLDVKGKSKVEILDTDIQKFEHHIADRAIVTFRGLALPKLSANASTN